MKKKFENQIQESLLFDLEPIKNQEDEINVTEKRESSNLSHEEHIKNLKQLSAEQLREKQKKLTDEVARHSYNYYVLDKPTIADREFDALYDELLAIEELTGVVLKNSPTQRVGGETLKGFKKYPHKYRLYSLNKCQTKDELFKWVEDVHDILPRARFTCEYKFDGLSLVCTYKDGYFVFYR